MRRTRKRLIVKEFTVKMKTSKPKYLITGALLFAASWIGYWLGHLGHQPTTEKHGVIAQQHLDIIRQNVDANPAPIDHPMAVDEERGLNERMRFETKNEIDSNWDQKRTVKEPVQRQGSSKGADKEVLLESVRAKMAQHEAQKNKQLDQHAKLNDQQVLHKEYIAQQRSKKEGPEKTAEQVKPVVNKQVDDGSTHYTLIHNGLATRVHGQIHEHLKSLPEHIDKEAYIFQSDKLPSNARKRPSVGNGHIATVVHSRTVYMNALYNGYLNRSHRADIPSTCALNITSTEPASDFKRTYRLNVAEGIYSETSESDTYTLTQRLYAHRNLSRLLVVEIDLVRKELLPLTLNIELNKWTPSHDVTFLSRESGMKEVSYKFGRTNAPETDWLKASEVHVLYDHIPDKLIAPDSHKRVKWVFLSSIAHTKEDAIASYETGVALVKSNDGLYSSHVQAWSDVWAHGRIDVVGNNTLAKALYASNYYILSSMPITKDKKSPFVGLSPSGLPYGELDKDYQGHVFWDQETWMYPPVLFFHSDLAKIILGTRNRTAKMAEKFAGKNGRTGMQYPWESAFTGWDVTPDKIIGEYELHISGDISRAIVQYLYATGDTSIIQGAGRTYADILAGIAHFWVSKLDFNQQLQKYEIKSVVPPDEDVLIRNNSVYTNTIARMSLSAVEYVLTLLNNTEPRWTRFADNIYIPFDTTLQYHPEFDGYIKGTRVKQADAVLLGYPLLQHMPTDVRKNDLSFYQRVTRSTGPAMSWSMFSIGWLEVGDKQQGHQLFHKNFDYIDPAFQVWNEQTNGDGATNFITGMGGFLQNVISGYGGFRLHKDQLEFNPTLPPGVKSMHFVDIDYLGSSLDFFYSDTDMIFTLRRQTAEAVKLVVYIYEPEQVHSLILNQVVKLETSPGAILSAGVELPDNDNL